MRRPFAGGIFLAALLAAAGLGAAVDASVGRIRLPDLIKHSDAIVLARVDGLLSFDGLITARATAVRVLKGDPAPGASFYFVADSTWACDISTAVRGETALLFLRRGKSDRVERRLIGKPTARVMAEPFYFIEHSGRGRMPVRRLKGQQVVTPSGEIEMPRSLRQRTPLPRGTFSLDQMEREIRSNL